MFVFNFSPFNDYADYKARPLPAPKPSTLNPKPPETAPSLLPNDVSLLKATQVAVLGRYGRASKTLVVSLEEYVVGD